MAAENRDIVADAAGRQRNQSEFARNKSERRNEESSSAKNRVNRKRTSSRKAEAAAAHEPARKGEVRQWRRANTLIQVEAPAGFHIEHVRLDNQNRGDLANLYAHIEEGWEPCTADDFPGRRLPTRVLPVGSDGQDARVIGNAGTILMKIPLEMKAQRDRFFNDKRDTVTRNTAKPNPAPEGVQHPSMPIVEDVVRHTSSTQQSRGRRMQVKPAD